LRSHRGWAAVGLHAPGEEERVGIRIEDRLLRALAAEPAESDEVLGDLVDMLFATVRPAILMGVTLSIIGGLIATIIGGPVLLALIGLALAISALRVSIILAYRRRHTAQPELSLHEIRQWELRYGVSSCAFALVLGLFNAYVLTSNDLRIAMLISGVIFGYGSGLVAGMSIRPVICVSSLALAVVPTVLGLAWHFRASGFERTAYLTLALQSAIFATVGLESIAHYYKTTVSLLRAKRDLARSARRDPLTGMPNRLALPIEFAANLQEVALNGGTLALHALDLDGFKEVNDRYGHPTGDQLLQTVAARLRNTIKPQDTAARLGGDEFVILQAGVHETEDAESLAERCSKVLSAPYSIDGQMIEIGVSMGIALLGKDGESLEKLWAAADAALYEAKRQGKNRFVFSKRG